MISKKKTKMVFYFVFANLILSILTRFYDQLGILQITFVLSVVALVICFYWFFKLLSNKISLHAKIRLFYATNQQLTITFVGEHKQVLKSKKIWSYENVFFAKCLLGFWFAIALYFSFPYVFTFVHEVSHAITAAANGGQVRSITIYGSNGGLVEYHSLGADYRRSLVCLAGTLGSAIFGLTLAIVIYRKKKMKLEVFVPIYLQIGHNILGEVVYWHNGVFQEFGDPWNFLRYLPQVDGSTLTNFCVLFYCGLYCCLVLFLIIKIVFRVKNFVNKYIPDLSDLNSTIFPLIQAR